MTPEVKAYISLGAGAVSFVLMFIFLYLKGKTPANKLREKALRDGTVTTARCAKQYCFHDYDQKLSDYIIVTYEYTVGGKSYRKKIKFSCSGVSPEYPYEVKVYYNKSNPRRAYTSAHFDGNFQKHWGCCTTMLAPIAVAALTRIALMIF